MGNEFGEAYTFEDFEPPDDISGAAAAESVGPGISNTETDAAPTVDEATYRFWEQSRPHREFINKMMLSASDKHHPSLCVLGAGNCLTLDLPILQRRFRTLTLVDANRDRLIRGLHNQNLAPSAERVVLDIDISGTARLLQQWSGDPGPEAMLDELFATADQFQPSSLGHHDVVVSNSLLVRILQMAIRHLGSHHDRVVELLKLLRSRHLQIMIDALEPGGHGLLISPFVSSETLPALAETDDLASTVGQAIESENYFAGLNPQRVWELFHSEPILGQVSEVKLANPWRWYTPGMTYACFAVGFRKNSP